MNQPSNSEICQDRLRLMGLELFDALFFVSISFHPERDVYDIQIRGGRVLIAGDDVAVPV